MLREQRQHHRRKFRTLRFVDADRVGVHERVEFGDIVSGDGVVEGHRHRVLFQVHGRDVAHVAVEDLPLVIVSDLHDAIPYPQDPRPVGELRFAGGGWIERLLQLPVERRHACRAAMHGAEHLHIAFRVQPEFLRNAPGDDVEHQRRRLFRVFLSKEEEIPRFWRKERQLAPFDAMGVDDDVAVVCLTEDRLQSRHRYHAAGDEILQDVAGADGGELIPIADQQQMAARLHRLEQVMDEQQVYHRGFVHDDEIGVEGIFLIAEEAIALHGFEFQQPVQGFGLEAGELAQALGGAPRRRGEQYRVSPGLQELDDSAGDRRLAGPRPTGEDGDFLREGHFHRPALRFYELEAVASVQPGAGALPIQRQEVAQPIARAVQEQLEFGGDALFGLEEGRQVDGFLFGNDFFGGEEGRQGRFARRGGNLQQLRGGFQQLRPGGEAVPLVAQLAERVAQSRLEALRRVVRDAHLPRDLVRRLEAHSPDVLRQPIGGVLDDGDGFIAVLLEDFHREARAHVVALQEEHDFLDLFLLFPGGGDACGAFLADARHFAQAIDVSLDDVERLQAEVVHDPPGVDGADAADQAAAEVFAQPLQGRGQLHGVLPHLELPAVAGMLNPHAAQSQRLAHARPGQLADDGHFAGLATGDDFGDGVAVLLILEGDALQRPLQGLEGNLGGGSSC